MTKKIILPILCMLAVWVLSALIAWLGGYDFVTRNAMVAYFAVVALICSISVAFCSFSIVNE